MKRIISWFANNGVSANLLMGLIVVLGLVALPGLKQEVFPEFSADIISVRVPYPGAAPEEVEEGVVVRVEESIQDLEGIKKVRSTASENMGTVLIEIQQGTKSQQLLNDVKSRVDAIDTFPEEAEEPIIEEAIIRRQVLEVAISGDTDERTLKHISEGIRDDLLASPGITQIELAATRPYEISIEVSEESLRRYGITLDSVAQAVRRSSLDLPGGKIETAEGEILIRTEGQAYSGAQFEELPLRAYPDGSRLKIADVATVVDGFADTERWSRFDGRPTAIIQVFRVGDERALDVAAIVKTYLEGARTRLPAGIHLTVWQDQTRILRGRLDLLLKNGRIGFLLVAMVLALFLKFRLAGWVSLGIPISFLGAIALIPVLDLSINLVSLFAFIIVLGIVVDDAIIVGENIYSHYQRGKSELQAAIDGATEVVSPVIFAVLTSIAAFAPLLLVSGTMGKIMRVIPLIVISTLLISLVESLLILPHHLSHLRHGSSNKSASRLSAGWRRLQSSFGRGLDNLVTNVYRPTLHKAVEWRYLTMACMLALLLITFGIVQGGWIKFIFMPAIEADNVAAYLTMPEGTPSEQTAKMVQRMEKAALVLQQDLNSEFDQNPILHVMTSIGAQPAKTANGPAAFTVDADASSPHLGEVNLELAPAEDRSVNSTEIAALWREKVGAIPDAVEISYSSSIFSSGEAINIQLSGRRVEALEQAADRLRLELKGYPGVQDITDSFRAGKKELELRITREAESAGLTQQDLARQVRQAFYGEEAQRIQRGRDDVKVMVRYPESQRRSLEDVENLRIRLPDSVEIPFSTAANSTISRGPSAIRRTDRRRIVNVTADVDDRQGNANEIIAALQLDVLPKLLADFPGIHYSLEGEQQEQRDSMSGLARGFGVALLVIYALLAVPFKSYFQPLIVMSAIPFGLIGAIFGHLVMGMNLAILSIFGIVALTGVVVNDSLVMVDFINRSFRSGKSLSEAVFSAGVSRFRPILLTSLTTFAGLTPLLLERSLQAQFLIPMAISLAFGVLFATVITLILVPCLYIALEDIITAMPWLRSQAHVQHASHDSADSGVIQTAE